MVTEFLAFAAASVMLALIPGPDTLVVLRAITVRGRRTAALTAAGILTGLALWIFAAALGLTAMLRASHDGYLALRFAGAAYLLYVGVLALRHRGTDIAANPTRRIMGWGYRAGLLTDLLNPKVGVFFITFLPAFVPHGEPMPAVTFGLGAVFLAVSIGYYVVMLAFVDRLLRWLRSERFQRSLSRVSGLALIAFGVRMAVES